MWVDIACQLPAHPLTGDVAVPLRLRATSGRSAICPGEIPVWSIGSGRARPPHTDGVNLATVKLGVENALERLDR
jgi:hypothetical protein